MDGLWLVFDNQTEAQTALQAIYSNMVANINSPDLLDVMTDEVVPKDGLAPIQRAEYTHDNRRFPIFGVNLGAGAKDIKDGFTTAWAIENKTLQGKFVFPKPPDQWMTGVTGFVAEPYNQDWF